jgi:phosphate-selective porin OprO/OprP
MNKLDIWRTAALLISLAAIPQAAPAQQYGASDETQMVKITDATYASLMSRLENLEAALAENAGKKKDDGWKDVSDEKWNLKWGGRMQLDYYTYAAQNADSMAIVAAAPNGIAGGDAPNYFEARRMRFAVAGEGYGVHYFNFEVDFEVPANVQMRDCYYGIHHVPLLGDVQFGNFKAPFSLEELVSDNYITCMERSLMNCLTPQRQVGVAAFNRTESENITWAYGVFFDSIDQSTKELVDDRQGTTLVARGTWLPYYDEPSHGRYLMHTGIGFRYTDDRDNSITFASRPETHLGPTFCSTGPFFGSDFHAVCAEAALVWGPFSLQSEITCTRANALGGAIVPATNNILAAGPYDFYGGYVEASYFLTGESRPYKRSTGVFDRVKPNTNFWLVRGAGLGPGAIQLVSRWSYLDTSGTAFALSGTENNVTTGVNWHWNPHLRWMFEWIHTWNKYDNRPAGFQAENDLLAVTGRVDW